MLGQFNICLEKRRLLFVLIEFKSESIQQQFSQMKKLHKPISSTPLGLLDLKENIQPSKKLLPLKNNINNTSIINHMKLELSNIKIDVEKLMNQEFQDTSVSKPSSSYQIQNQNLDNDFQKTKSQLQILEKQQKQYKRDQISRTKQWQELMDSNRELQSRIKEVEMKKSAIQLQKLKLETQYHMMQGAKSRLEKQHGLQFQLQSKIAEQKLKLQTDNLTLQTQLKKIKSERKELQKLKREAYQFKQENKRMQTTLQNQEIIIKDQQIKIKIKEDQITQLHSQLSNQKQKTSLDSLQSLRQKNQALVLDVQKKDAKITQIQIQLSQNHSYQDSKTFENQNLIASLHKQISELNKQILLFKKQQQLKATEVQTLRTQIVCFEKNEKKMAQMMREINEKNSQIINLKSDLKSSRQLQSLINQSQDKVCNSTVSRQATTYFEIELQNKTQEIQSLYRKMEVMSKKIEAKNSQLKQKNQFINNFIVNKVKKQQKQSECEFIEKQLQKYLSNDLFERLNQAQKQIIILTQKYQNQKLR